MNVTEQYLTLNLLFVEVLSGQIHFLNVSVSKNIHHQTNTNNAIFPVTCTSIKETESTYANCTYKNSPVSCDKPVYGTRAKFTCKDLYEDLNSALNPNRICGDDGTWDYQFPNCIPSENLL